MMRSFKKQVLNSQKNTEIKYPEGDKMFAGFFDGSIQGFSMSPEITVDDYGQVSNNVIYSMAKTPNNKS